MDDDQDDADTKPGASVTPELFREWRLPRYGRVNPERMDNPVWEWLIKSEISAYWAKKEFDGATLLEDGPGWSFKRFGQSSTELEDGRIVLIAGEHEDSYDSDFFIYNDVVVKNPNGTLEIYCYPKEIFIPTDSHSATLAGNRIVLIGSLGYPKERKPGTTQVYVLDLPAFAINAIECTGNSPGWLHKHTAAYVPDENAILITGGMIFTGDEDRQFRENIDDWKLHLADWRWERLTQRRWQQWELRRESGELNSLFYIENFAFWSCFKGNKPADEQLNSNKEALGFEPDVDLFAELYSPPVPYEKIPENEDEYGVCRIRVNGVTVRYVVDIWSVRIAVEEDLPASTTETLVSDLQNKLSALEKTPYEIIRL